MISLPGYRILEEIGENRNTKVYRGFSEQDGKNVIIKTSAPSHPLSDELSREFELSGDLDIEGIIKSYRIERYDEGIALIMEDIGGVSLKKMIIAGSANFREKLMIVLKVVEILGRLHEKRIIHGDIKPSNIIVNPASFDVRITDLAYSRMSIAGESAVTEMIPGTLSYISPEQTGRMNRVPDYRTDFYSLGVTMFELFSGELPFRSRDPIELIYSHITKIPEPLNTINPAVPEVISGIVERLLAKNPEDRYQSAFGIRHDLERCLNMLEQKGSIESFHLAEKDVSEWLNIPHKVYGREREKTALVEAYDRIKQGRSEVVLLHGSAGIGKTTLIQETFRPMIFRNAFFIEGKYDRLKQDIPYSGIIQAFRGLIRQLLTGSVENLGRWKEDLQAAFGINGRIILDVIPEVEFIVGPQPPIHPLGPAEMKNVFNTVFLSSGYSHHLNIP